MSGLLAAALLMVPLSGAGLAAALVEIGPARRCEARHLVVEYDRPWGELPVHRGRIEAGYPLGPLWLGATAGGMDAPTVTEATLGVWAAIAGWVRSGVVRRELRVAGLDAMIVYDVDADLRMAQGPLALGWSADAIGLGDPVAPPAMRRAWWVGVSSSSSSFCIGLRTQAWSNRPEWDVSLQVPMGEHAGLAVHWSASGAQLGLRFGAAGADVTALTVWSGPRAGALALRLESRR